MSFASLGQLQQQLSNDSLSDEDNNDNCSSPPRQQRQHIFRPGGNSGQVTTVKGAMGDGQASVTLSSLLSLLDSATDKSAPPTPLIKRANYYVYANKLCAHVRTDLLVHVLDDRWTRVKLFSRKVAVSCPSVQLVALDDTLAADKGQEEGQGDGKGNVQQTTQVQVGAVMEVGVDEQGNHALIVNKAGRYLVQLELDVPYTTTRETALKLSVPLATQNQLELHVAKSSLEVKVDPALFMSQEDGSADDASQAGGCMTVVKCRLPPTRSISMQWTPKAAEVQAELKEKLPKTVTSTQSALHSIGEGIVASNVRFVYTILNGSVSLLHIGVSEGARVLSVDGLGVKRWEMVEQQHEQAEEGAEGADTEVDSGSRKVLKVHLEYGIEDRYELCVQTEVEMKGTSCDVDIPTFRSFGEGLKREKGHVGIEARTNVEVQFLDGVGLAMIDTSELDQYIWAQASNAIIMGYKFLHPDFALSLNVKKHSDVDVLIAVVEKAHITVSVTEEGRMLTKIVAQVRNTQRQFLRVETPKGSEVWSTVVAGKPVKPAMDKDARLMIPLNKSSFVGAEGEANKPSEFCVEFVYLQRPDGPDDNENNLAAMQTRGSLAYLCPKLDIPINHLLVSLYVPANYRYAEFESEGNLKETKRFSTSVPSATSTSTSSYGQQSNLRRDSMIRTQMPSKSKARSKKIRRARAAGKAHGVLPVQVDVPLQGTEFKFEQLLVSGMTSLSLSVEYLRIKKKAQRKLDGCCVLM